MKNNELVSYAMDFASYLALKVDGIDRIVLYGSVVRGDFDENSDVDLFVDSCKKIEKKVEKSLEDYRNTKRLKEWHLKGIKNEISAVVGRLDSEEWKNLKRGIMTHGIVLYGRYTAKAEKVKHYALVSFENIRPDKKRVVLFRKMFGFKVGNKKYDGLVKKTNAVRVGKGSILVPIEHFDKVRDYMKEKKIAVKVYDLWSDSEF